MACADADWLIITDSESRITGSDNSFVYEDLQTIVNAVIWLMTFR